MFIRLTVVTTLIAFFALSFSVLADSARQRSYAAPAFASGGDCLTGGLFCAPGAGSRN